MSAKYHSLLLTLLAVTSSSMFSSCIDNKSLSEVDTMQFSISGGSSAAVTRASEHYTIKSTDGMATLTVIVGDNISEPLTKGDMVTTATLQTIGVSTKAEDGSNYFTNVQFKKDKDGIMKCDPAYYWLGNSSLDCYLYYPYMDKSAESVWGLSINAKQDIPAIKYRTPSNALIHRDLLYGFCNSCYGTPEVKMRHLLAAVDFKIGDYLPVGSCISSFLLCNIFTEGTVSLNKDEVSWAIDSIKVGSTTPGMTFYPTIWKMTDGMKKGDTIFGDFFIIPQQIPEDIDAYATIDGVDASGNSLLYNFSLKNITFSMGKRYTFYISFPKQ